MDTFNALGESVVPRLDLVQTDWFFSNTRPWNWGNTLDPAWKPVSNFIFMGWCSISDSNPDDPSSLKPWIPSLDVGYPASRLPNGYRLRHIITNRLDVTWQNRTLSCISQSGLFMPKKPVTFLRMTYDVIMKSYKRATIPNPDALHS